VKEDGEEEGVEEAAEARGERVSATLSRQRIKKTERLVSSSSCSPVEEEKEGKRKVLGGSKTQSRRR
jgi:hypothetical protein